MLAGKSTFITTKIIVNGFVVNNFVVYIFMIYRNESLFSY